MDGLFGLIWVVFIVVTLTNALTGKNKNKKNQRKSTGFPPVAAKPVTKPAEAKSFQDWFEDLTAAQAKPQEAPKAPEAKPAPIEPRVHVHLAPDCDIDEPSGSMAFTSTEGSDPCHDDALPDRRVSRPSFPVQQEQPGLALEWNSDALVRSVIMQEVLTRPCQRKRR